MKKVVVVSPVHQAGFDVLASRPDLEVVRPASVLQEDLVECLGDADAVLLRGSHFPPHLVEAAPRLRIISRHGVGLDNVPLKFCAERGVRVTHVGDVNAVPVAEHTLAMLLGVAKQLIPYDRAVREGRYSVKEGLATRELQGRTMLILGVGRIGREVARLASAFRMSCLGFDPVLSSNEIRLAGCEAVSDWRSVLPEADVVTLHLPLMPETRNLLGAVELASMRPTAIVLNCARGGLIDEAALDSALTQGRLFGAGLDVTAIEPPAQDNPLLVNDRVVLSPHSAALTLECAMRMAERSAQNIIDFFDGQLEPSYIAA